MGWIWINPDKIDVLLVSGETAQDQWCQTMLLLKLLLLYTASSRTLTRWPSISHAELPS